MIQLIGISVGLLIVIMVPAACIIAQRVFPEHQKPIKRGDGRYSIGPVLDIYGEPHLDQHGGSYLHLGPWLK
jgi:hypothetical protein